MKSTQWPLTRKRLPPLESLRVLEVATRTGGFANAASELNLTPNSVAHHIAKLEEWFGFPLFQRQARGVTACPGLERYVGAVSSTLDHLSRLTADFSHRMLSPTIALTAMPTLVTCWLLPCVMEFEIARPDAKIDVLATPEVSDFETDAIDIAVREGQGGWPGLGHDLLFEEWWAPVCTSEYADRMRLRGPEDLLKATLLFDQPWHGTPDQILWDQWFRHANTEPVTPKRQMTFSHSYLSIRAAIDGYGVALANLAMIVDEMMDGSLVSPCGSWIRGPYSIYLVHQETANGKESAVELMAHIRQAASRRRDLMQRLCQANSA